VLIYLTLNVQSNNYLELQQISKKGKYPFIQFRQFQTKMRTPVIIGPHNEDVISVLVGCLLRDADASKTKGKIVGTHLRFKQSGRHKDYLFFFIKFFL
jgi:hypothetical protein